MQGCCGSVAGSPVALLAMMTPSFAGLSITAAPWRRRDVTPAFPLVQHATSASFPACELLLRSEGACERTTLVSFPSSSSPGRPAVGVCNLLAVLALENTATSVCFDGDAEGPVSSFSLQCLE